MKALLQKITAIVGEAGVLTGEDVRNRATGWTQQAVNEAGAIVRPASTTELAEVMKLCHAAGQPIVPLGGGTGLVDGAHADSHEIQLSTERMTAIEELDVAGGTMTVQAGVPLQTAQDRAAEAGLTLPVDFGARGTATIGGAVSTNAGGNAVIRYGMMREQVLGLEAVLADGTVVSSMNRMLKNNAGYDLKQLFIGTEGTLGIVTRVVLRLRPLMRSQATAFVAVDAFDKIPALLRLCGGGLGGTLSAFEVLWADFYTTILGANPRHAAPLAADFPFYVLIEATGGDQESDQQRFEDTLAGAMEKDLVADAAIAGSGAQRSAFWAIRDDIDTLVKSLFPPIAFDISLPISHADAYVGKVRARLDARWPETFRCTTFGHLGDSNIHFVMTIGDAAAADRTHAMEIVYEELEPFGGSVSAEHGIGLEKRAWLKCSRSETELALMRSLKNLLDPKGILNPGKVLDRG